MSTSQAQRILRVICWAPLSSSWRRRFEGISDRLSWEFREHGEVDDIVDADVWVAPQFRLHLARAARLTWIQFDSAGVEDVLDQVRPYPHMRVTNASGVYATIIAEFVVANLLRVASEAVRRDPWRRQRHWPIDSVERARLRHLPLRGRTAVIVGYGGVGREIARLLSAFGVRIIAVKARPETLADSAFRVAGTGDPAGTIPSRVVGPAAIENVLPAASFLILTAPLTLRTRHIVNSRVLAKARHGLLLVNVGRGGLVDEGALLDALESGAIGRAILDVLEEEPPPTAHPFWDHPRVDLTPHISGGGSVLGGDLFAMLLEANVRRFVTGAPLLNQVDIERGY